MVPGFCKKRKTVRGKPSIGAYSGNIFNLAQVLTALITNARNREGPNESYRSGWHQTRSSPTHEFEDATLFQGKPRKRRFRCQAQGIYPLDLPMDIDGLRGHAGLKTLLLGAQSTSDVKITSQTPAIRKRMCKSLVFFRTRGRAKQNPSPPHIVEASGTLRETFQFSTFGTENSSIKAYFSHCGAGSGNIHSK